MTTNVPLIMVVENEPVLCQIIRCILEKSAYRVITANDALHALELVRIEEPALVILGNLHSRVEKNNLVDYIRGLPKCQIVFFVSNSETLPAPGKNDSGVEDIVINKPVSMKKILAVAGHALTVEKVAVRL